MPRLAQQYRPQRIVPTAPNCFGHVGKDTNCTLGSSRIALTRTCRSTLSAIREPSRPSGVAEAVRAPRQKGEQISLRGAPVRVSVSHGGCDAPAGSRQRRLTRARRVSSERRRSGKGERTAAVPRHSSALLRTTIHVSRHDCAALVQSKFE